MKHLIKKLFRINEPAANDPFGPREQFDAVFSNLPLGIAFLTTEMRYIRVNPFLEKKFGRSSDELKGKHCYETVGMHSKDPSKSGEEKICDNCPARATLRTGMSHRHTRHVNPDLIVENISVPMNGPDGKLLGVAEIIMDVTDRVKLDERLQEYANGLEEAVSAKTREIRKSKMFLNNIIESATDAILTLDSGGRISFMNPAAETVLGRPKQRLMGMDLLDLVAPKDKEDLQSALGMAFAKGVTFKNLRLSADALDGSERGLMMSLAPLSDDEKNRLVAICKDVSKEAQLDIEREEFIAMLTHDMKTPLTTIVGYTSLMLSGELGPLSDEVISAVEGVQSSSQRMMGLIKNFLVVGRIDRDMLSISPGPLHVESLIMDSLGALHPQIKERRIDIETSFATNLPRAHADREQIERVVCNLISNALKFTPPGGKVSVNAYHTDDGFVTMEVSDTGLGIPPEEIPRLFDKYYQGRQTGKSTGTGLGLYIAKNIVEAHQGTIEAKSVRGKGSTFTIRLPQIV